MVFCQLEKANQGKGECQVDNARCNEGLEGEVEVGVNTPRGTRDVKDRWDGTGQRGAVQHHDDLVRVGRQGAAHRRGQHDATQNL